MVELVCTFRLIIVLSNSGVLVLVRTKYHTLSWENPGSNNMLCQFTHIIKLLLVFSREIESIYSTDNVCVRIIYV